MEEKKNEVALFEQQYLAVFQQLQQIKVAKTTLEKQEKEAKEKLEKAMSEYGIKSIKNDYITISYVEGSTTEAIDLAALKEKEPELYEELLNDYKKVTSKKAYVKFLVK